MKFKQPHKTFLYAIGRAAGPIKIGYASDPKSRRSQIQCGCPFEVQLFFTAEVADPGVAMSHERTIRSVYDGSHIRGEWYKLDLYQAQEAIECSIITAEAFA